MTEEIIVKIRNFVLHKFPIARRRNISDNDDLLESGVIDSMGVLELVTFLQEEFALNVTDEELTPEHFQSIKCMATFVADSQRVRAATAN